MSTPSSLAASLPFRPTQEQHDALCRIQQFLSDKESDAFVLRGAAGTGKTSLTKAVTSHLHSTGVRFHLLAPTGRAARVVGQKTGFGARTIHSLIYTPESLDESAVVRFVRRTNELSEPAVYVVDEASMVSDTLDSSDTFVAPRPLLTDLVDSVKQGNPVNKLILIGDKFQLPPVKSPTSPALDGTYLRRTFGLTVYEGDLTTVMRQSAGSYILESATELRRAMEAGRATPRLRVRRLTGPTQNVDRFLSSFDASRPDSATMMAWTNKDVNWMNNACRSRLGVPRQGVSPGEPVILQRPWVGAGHWLVNGDQGVVTSVGSSHGYAGLTFVEVDVLFHGGAAEDFIISTLAIQDVLSAENGALSTDQEQKLYHAVMRDNPDFRDSRRMSDDRHVGALRLRYGYSLTAHKAQGGEWDEVFLHPYFCPDPRWQYTAATRARTDLYSYEHPYPGYDYLAFMN